MRPLSPKVCAVVAVVSSLFSGCGGSNGSVAPSPVESVNIGGVALSETITGDAPLEFTLKGTSLDSVRVQYSVDGKTWRDATLKRGSSLNNLESTPEGFRHRIVWDSIRDLGFRGEGRAQISVKTRDDEVTVDTNYDNIDSAADRIESYLIHFGPFDADKIRIAERHDLVILSPCSHTITRDVVAEIQDGVDSEDPADDVICLAYINVGEDQRTIGLTDEDLLKDSRFIGNGSGPRVDPRGPFADGAPLTDIDPLGLSSGSGGYASWYLDDVSLDQDGVGDGRPDRNQNTGACYVNLGDPSWFEALKSARCETDSYPGFDELLTFDIGEGFGFDGVYLDNVDTCAPNAYTSPSDPVQSEFEWTAPGYATFVQRIKSRFPKSLVMQNRGLFFFNPGLPHYAVSNREDIDFLGFESYRLDSDPSRQFDPAFFQDNKFNFTPKIQAEANRLGGFQVLSLGYSEGPGLDSDTLLGRSTSGFDSLIRDIVEAQDLAGFRHYIHDGGGQVMNGFVRRHAIFDDESPPQWTSTYNANTPPSTNLPEAPTPRVGVQQLIAKSQAVTVRWDVALDLNPVSYVIYYDDDELEFDESRLDRDTRRLVVHPEISEGYSFGAGPDVYPYEVTIDGLKRNRVYYFAVRAIDSIGNEDTNNVQLSVRTSIWTHEIDIDGRFADWIGTRLLHRDGRDASPSGGPDWRDIRARNDDDFLYIYFSSDDRFNLDGSPDYEVSQMRIDVDADDNPFTGLSFGDMGSEIYVLGDGLHESEKPETGPPIQGIQIEPKTRVTRCELAIPLQIIDQFAGGFATRIRLHFSNPSAPDVAPNSGHLAYEIVR